MKLTSAALNYDYFDLPKQLNNIHLTAEDAQLSHEEKLEKARNMVFNDDYHHNLRTFDPFYKRNPFSNGK